MKLQLHQISAFLPPLGVSLQSVAMVFVLVCIEWFGWFAPVRAAGERLVTPITSLTLQVMREVQSPIYVLTNRDVSIDEFRQLQSRYAQALVKVSQLEAVQAENKLLREVVDIRSPDREERVLAVPILTADGTFIGAGSDDGITSGSLVVANGILVGFIREQSAHQSRVFPLHQLPIDTPILVKTEQGATGLVHGSGKQIVLREVSRDGSLAQGDRVLTAGQEGIQAGLLLGTIRTVDTRPSAPTLSAVLDQPVSLYEVALVEIW